MKETRSLSHLFHERTKETIHKEERRIVSHLEQRIHLHIIKIGNNREANRQTKEEKWREKFIHLYKDKTQTQTEHTLTQYHSNELLL